MAGKRAEDAPADATLSGHHRRSGHQLRSRSELVQPLSLPDADQAGGIRPCRSSRSELPQGADEDGNLADCAGRMAHRAGRVTLRGRCWNQGAPVVSDSDSARLDAEVAAL